MHYCSINTTAKLVPAIRSALESYRGLCGSPIENQNRCQSSVLFFTYSSGSEKTIDTIVHTCPRNSSILVKSNSRQDVQSLVEYVMKQVPKTKHQYRIQETTNGRHNGIRKVIESHAKVVHCSLESACQEPDTTLYEKDELKPDPEVPRSVIAMRIIRKRALTCGTADR